MGQSEYAAALAEQHVREAEQRVAQQLAIVERLEEIGHGWAADEARKMLTVKHLTLEIARVHLGIARALLDD